MGRGNAQTVEQLVPSRPREVSFETTDTGSSLRFLVERLELRVARARTALAAGDLAALDPDRYRATLARELGVLPPYEQRALVRAARSYEGPRQQHVRSAAAELLVLTNYGLITDFIRLYSARGLEEQVLRAEAESAIPVAIAKFDFDKGANFVTYLLERMRHSVGSAVRADGRLVRLKSEMGLLAEKVRRAEGLLIRDGEAPTDAAIAELVSATPEKVAEVKRWLEMSYVSLDAPLGEDGQNFAEVIADPVSHFSDEISESSQDDSVAEALKQLPASQRFLLTQIVGLEGGECCEQKDFVCGVYVDGDGNRFTSERSVSREVAGAIKRERTVLLRLLEQGHVRYEPLNQQTEQLYRLLRQETGTSVPPSIDQIESLLKHAKRSLRESAELRSAREQLRYRGPDAIKHSAEARALVRRELELRIERDGAIEVPGLGLVDLARVRTLHGPTDRNDADESELTKTAIFFGLVEPETRKLTTSFSSATLSTAPSPEYEQPRPAIAAVADDGTSRRTPRVHRSRDGGRVSMADLLREGLLQPRQQLVAHHKGRRFEARIEHDGSVLLADGRRLPSPSAAAEALLGRPEGGWTFWRIQQGDDLVQLDALRARLAAA